MMSEPIYDYKRFMVDKKTMEEHLGYEIDEKVFYELVEKNYYNDDLEQVWLKRFIDDEEVQNVKDELVE